MRTVTETIEKINFLLFILNFQNILKLMLKVLQSFKFSNQLKIYQDDVS